mgnify:CR=1 FL=1
MATLVEPDDAEFRVDLGVVLWRLRDFGGAEEQLRDVERVLLHVVEVDEPTHVLGVRIRVGY